MKKQIADLMVLLMLGFAFSGGSVYAQAQTAHPAQAAGKTALKAPAAKAKQPQQQADAGKPVPRDDRMGCIYGIEALEMRLISQYPYLTQNFIDNYPQLASEAAASCSSYVAYFIKRTGKPVNMQNVRGNVGEKLKLGETVPDTLRSLETFRELMVDGE